MSVRAALLELKRRLYLYVALTFAAAFAAGLAWDFSGVNIRPVSVAAVFLMLYPMLTGLEVERVKRAHRSLGFAALALFYAYIVASATAFAVSRTILAGFPDLALALVIVGAVPCSNMLIGWAGIAEASVEEAFVIAVAGLLLIPFLSPTLISLSGGVLVPLDPALLFLVFAAYIFVPLVLGLATRRYIISRRGPGYYRSIKPLLPGVAATGVLLIVFFTVAKVARLVAAKPVIFGLVLAGLLTYYAAQTLIASATALALRLPYARAMLLVIAATASSQAISLGVAATLFSPLTVFALSFKPMIQVAYIIALIYGLGPWLRRRLP